MRRILGFLLIALGIAAAFAAADFFILLRPAQVDAFVRAKLAEVFAHPFRLAEVSFSLRRGVRLRGLEVLGPGAEPILAVDEASIAVDWRRLALREIRIRRPEIHIARDAQGRLALAHVFRAEIFERAAPRAELPALAIAVEDARVRFLDESFGDLGPWRFALDDIDFDVVLGPARGVEVHGSITDPVAKSLAFAADFSPATGTFAANVEGRKVNAGERMRSFLPPQIARVFRMLGLFGIADADLHFHNRGRLPVEYGGTIKVLSGGMRFEKFPYPAADVTGEIRIETGHVMLRGLRGQKDKGAFGCDGDVYLMPKGVDDRIDIRIWARDFPVDAALGDALPPEVAAIYRRFAPTARADARVRVHGFAKPRGVPDDIHWEILGDVRDLAARFDALPIPATGLAGRVEIRDERFAIERLAGEALHGALEVEGFASPEQVAISVRVDGAEIGPAVRDMLPERERAIFDAIAPQGKLDARIAVEGERPADGGGGGLEPTFRARLIPRTGLVLRWEHFPYPLEAQGGEVVITPAGGSIEGVRAAAGTLEVGISGTIGAADLGTPVALAIDARGLEWSEAARKVLRGRAAAWAERAGIEAGRVTRARIVVRKAAFEERLDVSGSAGFERVRVRPPAFPYSVEDLEGALRFSPREIDIAALAARAGEARIAGEGRISLDPAVPSSAGVTVAGLAIDERLRAALPERARRIYERLAPRGRVDLAIAATGGGEGLGAAVEARVSEAAFTLDAFPYPVTQVEANFSWAEGRLSLDRLTGMLGDASLTAVGHVLPLGPWGKGRAAPGAPAHARLTLEWEALALDRRLRDALPAPLRRAFASADPLGVASGRATIDYDASLPRATVLYNAFVEVDCARLDVGLFLKDLRGRVRLEGDVPVGAAQTAVSGSFDVERASWKGQDLEHFSGQLALARGLLEVRELRGSFLGGLVRGEIYAWTEGLPLLGVDLSLAGGRLERRRASAGGGRATGRIDGRIAAVRHTVEDGVRGEGRIVIGEANLGRLPLIAGLLNPLSFEAPSRPVFDEATIAFRLDRERIMIDRAALSCAALSFLGKGEVNGGKLDLKFTHEVGRPWLGSVPIIGPLWGWVKATLLVEYEVTGTLDEPTVRAIPVKAVINPFRWLFGKSEEEGPRSTKRMED